MGIESNDFSNNANAQDTVRENVREHTSEFSGTNLGAGGAVSGSNDFLTLSSRIGISRIDSSLEPYIEAVLKLVRDNLGDVELVRLHKTSNSYAVKFNAPDGMLNFFGLQFVSGNDPVSQNMYPASIRLRLMQDELRETYKDKRIRLVDARIILAGYKADMDRTYEMADTIVRTFQMTSIAEYKNAQISSLTSNEFVVDWRISEARNLERTLSPHGIVPRMETALTLKAKISRELGREFKEFDTDYKNVGVIGGYAEIREKEEYTINNQRVMLYPTVFNITVCNATIPLEGLGAILMAAFAPTIYNTHFWAKQWMDLTEGRPNPGMVEEDPDNRGRPIVLKDQEELIDFVRNRFAPPVIVFQFQDGRDSIPGMVRMASTNADAKLHFVNRLAKFFNAQEETSAPDITRVIETRYDGAYGDPNGTLHDSRDIDYFYIAAKSGWGSIDAGMRRVLLSGSENPTDRARVIQQVTNSFIPLFFDTLTLINPDFIKWVITKTDAQRLVIIDPNSQTEARSLGSFLDGFGSAANMGSIVSTGAVNRGLNLGSVWNQGGGY